jgi:hypothetical protein
LFFVIAAAIGASSQAAIPISPPKPALVAAGCLWGFAVAMVFYSITRSQNASPGPKASILPWLNDLGYSVFIGMVVGSSLLLAQLIGLDNPYCVSWRPLDVIALSSKTRKRLASGDLDIFIVFCHRIDRGAALRNGSHVHHAHDDPFGQCCTSA